MAKKKTRVPAPPAPKSKRAADGSGRPVQAPRVRKKERAEMSRPSRLMIALAATGIAALVAVALVFVFARGGSSSDVTPAAADEAMKAAGCTVRSAPPLAFATLHKNVPSPTTPVRWNTFPPAAGAHYGRTAVWNFYRDPVNPRFVLHNQEHGGVILWWGAKTPASTVDELERFYQESPDAMLGTPLAATNPGITFPGVPNADLGSRVAITAWTIDNPANYFVGGNLGIGHVALCPSFDRDAFAKFRDAYRGHGPEAIPPQFNVPGGN
jgi:hypothetical protein